MIERVLVLILVMVCLVGCSKITGDEIAGEYIFRYSSGEFEVVVLNKNLTYEHSFYATVADYLAKRAPLFSFSAKWSWDQIQINLMDWMAFADIGYFQKPTLPPRKCSILAADWEEPREGSNAGILIGGDTGYNFLRVRNRQDVEKLEAMEKAK